MEGRMWQPLWIYEREGASPAIQKYVRRREKLCGWPFLYADVGRVGLTLFLCSVMPVPWDNSICITTEAYGSASKTCNIHRLRRNALGNSLLFRGTCKESVLFRFNQVYASCSGFITANELQPPRATHHKHINIMQMSWSLRNTPTPARLAWWEGIT